MSSQFVPIVITIIAWALIQACLVFVGVKIWMRLTKFFGDISMTWPLVITTIVGIVLALVINPIYLVGAILGIPAYFVILRVLPDTDTKFTDE